jgi:nucleotide-binding universal stress UspA family protein
MPGPVLFCYDGSEGSRGAMAAASELVAHPVPAVVLTIWQPAAVLIARGGGFAASYVSNEDEVDRQEESLAAEASREGVSRAQAHGYEASARVEEATEGAGRRIIEIADELDARLIVCGRRGLGKVAAALIGSVSQAVLNGAGRPVLIAPEKK